jgi:acetyl-CoA carboxylase alpha subunit
MFGLRVPVISVVIGEGGSGGALAIGCANRNLIMQNSVYYVASPEACAAILWKSRTASNQVWAAQLDDTATTAATTSRCVTCMCMHDMACAPRACWAPQW